MAPGVGFEPTTNALTARCATAAPPGNVEKQHGEYNEHLKAFQSFFRLKFLEYEDFAGDGLGVAIVDVACFDFEAGGFD